ncbi:MAG: ABC transporter ATP-binding protein [Anaerolineaceae bacterium]
MAAEMKDGFISTADLKKHYRMGETDVRALDGVTLQIQQGAFAVIMGPSGSGKSTLLNLIGGLDWPTSGSIRVDGEEIAALDENALASYRRNKLGFVFQSFNLVSSMTAEENVGFPLRFSGIKASVRKERAREKLEEVGLADRFDHKPTELSGGQQQRVAIARALINNPLLILADEPTGNLDTSSGTAVMHTLVDLQKAGKTILVATHDPRMLSVASEKFYLLDGKQVSEAQYHETIEKMTWEGSD